MPLAQQPPAPIRTDSSNAFAHHTMKVRVPAIIRDVAQRNPDYAPDIQQALEQLATALETNQPIPMLQTPAPDYDEWLAQVEPHRGETWLNSEWFFAEVYLYRLLMEAVRWWETRRDPFLPWKAEEVAGDGLWMAMDAALSTKAAPPEERLAELLLHALWGNRIDLSMKIAASHGTNWTEEDLLADDREAVVRHLFQAAPMPGTREQTVHIIVDNAGSELAMDLILAHALIQTGVCRRIMMHVKLHPTFVSDATTVDVLSFIRHLKDAGRNADLRQLGFDLDEMFERGQLKLAPDAYWNSTRFLWQIPARLRQTFKGGTLAILKGDANYRRSLGDALWEPETPFEHVNAYFPIPLLALRTLKSDAIVGLPTGKAESLSANDPGWRVTGRHGVIQFKPGYSSNDIGI